jgi:hypothetical protein
MSRAAACRDVNVGAREMADLGNVAGFDDDLEETKAQRSPGRGDEWSRRRMLERLEAVKAQQASNARRACNG